MLRRGQRASRTMLAAESTGTPQRLTLQTLGGGGALRGVLAIGDSPELDQAGREVVTAVIALAGLALEQNRDLDRARGHLRSGLLRSILAGDTALAERVAAEMWGELPHAPVRVMVTDAPLAHVDRLTELLELRVEERDGRLFFGRDDEQFVLVVEEADAALADELATEFELPVGVSDPVGGGAGTAGAAAPAHGASGGIALAHEQAMRALERARETGAGVSYFEEISRQGVLAFLARTDARAVALATLAPLTEHDAANGTSLVTTDPHVARARRSVRRHRAGARRAPAHRAQPHRPRRAAARPRPLGLPRPRRPLGGPARRRLTPQPAGRVTPASSARLCRDESRYQANESLRVRSPESKSTCTSPNRCVYPSAHSKLSMSDHTK